ncbi:MAG: hypothetical protein RIR26_1446 [Pseudomonadota bacterium]|jgi:hypothetical protein
MRLKERLKTDFQPSTRISPQCPKWLMFLKLLGGALSLALPMLSLTAHGAAEGCGADALSALPSRPVALSRVERSGEGIVRVAWPLRAAADEEEEVGGQPQQLQTGAAFDVLRCLPPGRWVALGQGEVVARNGALVEGVLNVAGQSVSVDKGVSAELISSGNLHPTPMVGDVIVVRKREIVAKMALTPKVTLPTEDLFGAAALADGALELTRSGQKTLRSMITESFAAARGRLLIEVHAQRPGSRVRLREETLQRAKSIERYLRYEFSLDKEQVVAVGMGADTYVPGFVEEGTARDFVVLRMLPVRNSVPY